MILWQAPPRHQPRHAAPTLARRALAATARLAAALVWIPLWPAARLYSMARP